MALLPERDEVGPTRDRHLSYFLQLAERAESELRRADQVVWLDRLEADLRGAPLSIVISAANVHDKRCAMAVIQACPLRKPRRRYRVHHFCADKAYDAADLRKAITRRRYQVHIAHRGLEPVIHKKYPARRDVVERTNSWTAQFRGLRVRWAKKADNWLAFLYLAAAITLCRMSIYR